MNLPNNHRHGILAAALALLVPIAAHAQQPDAARAHRNANVREALQIIQRDNDWTLDQQVSICEIPAPPFKEEQRAAEYRQRLESLGLANARIDAEGNVIAERPGTGNGPTVLISGHLDTVFPEETDVSVRREGTRFHAPGIGDDCRGLAVVLAVARAFQHANVQTNGTVYFVGTVGEEGAGNLRGVRHLFTKEFPNREIDYFISVDGTGYGTTNGAVGSHRYTVTYVGPGGHSFGAFGMPNPIHALGRAIAAISDLQVPASPRTTFNVGIIRGGTSVNSISATGSMDIDMRSSSLDELRALDAKVMAALNAALEAENARWPRADVKLTLEIDTIGIRPAGSQPDDAPIVVAALTAARELGLESETGSSSTDSNLPISMGIPAITIDGGGTGRGAHSLDEWYDDGTDGYRGPQWAALIVAALAGVR